MSITSFLRLAAASLALGTVSLAKTYNVSIVDDAFVPSVVTIAPGDTVVWTMNGDNSHTATALNGYFDSGQPFIKGTTFTVNFPDARTVPYQCSFHLGEMTGTVRVLDASGNVPPSTPVNATPPNGETNSSVSPTLKASAFSDPNEGDLHVASEWVIRSLSSGSVVLDTVQTSGNKTQLTVADLDGGTTYAWKVRYKDDVGAWSEYSTETQFTTVSAPTASGSGLTATYGAYAAATKKAPEKLTAKATLVDAFVDFDWKLGKANKAVSANNFFARWEGDVLPEFSERYRFRVRADGGVKLWVNNNLVVNDWVKTPFAVYRSAVVPLQAGVSVSIKLEYYDTTGASSASLGWSSMSQPQEIIPTANLFPLTP